MTTYEVSNGANSTHYSAVKKVLSYPEATTSPIHTYPASSIPLTPSGSATPAHTYPAPNVPVTPSATINKLLEKHCNKSYQNPIKYGVALVVCLLFTAINMLYGIINKEGKASHTMWMASSGAVAFVLTTCIVVAYTLLMTLVDLFLWVVLRWTFIVAGLAGVALCGVSAALFDRPTSKKEDAQNGYVDSKSD